MSPQAWLEDADARTEAPWTILRLAEALTHGGSDAIARAVDAFQGEASEYTLRHHPRLTLEG